MDTPSQDLSGPRPPAPAASVLLTRGPGHEVYAIRRSPALRFFGGFWAFPGGRLDPADGPADLAAHRTAACRELFEEAGVLIARRPDGSFLPASTDLNADRRALLAGELSFPALLAAHRLTVHAKDFTPVGTLTTPPFSAVRFATMFFVAALPDGQVPTIWPGELDEGCWITPPALLDRWRRRECLLTPPTVLLMQGVGATPLDEAAQRLGPVVAPGDALPPIAFAPQVQGWPLRTVALPPATHTNAYLVGAGPRYLIDPGCDAPDEQRQLFHAVDQAGPPTAIVLTHHHPDHVGAAAVCADRYRVPIWAHAETAARVRFPVDRVLQDGDRLDLGPCPIDGGPWALEARHTPGHAPGHLAFFEPRYGLLFAGDMLSTLTTIVIAPPDGDLAVYLASLWRLRELPARLLLPAHGLPTAAPDRAIDEALEHRARREAQLLAALAAGPADVDALAAAIYRGLPDRLMRFARAQVQAGLLKLQQDGRAAPAGDRWRLVE